jgi:hypothetical protein
VGFSPCSSPPGAPPPHNAWLEGLRAALTPLKGAWATGSVCRDRTRVFAACTHGHGGANARVSALLASFAAGVQRGGYRGVLLLVDELGKVFEFAARTHPSVATCSPCRRLPSRRAAVGAFPFLFFGFLHQSFDDYGQHLDGITRKEWAKIHGQV